MFGENVMHVLMVIVGGVVLLGVFALFGKLWGDAPGILLAAKSFIPVWLVLSIVNMWIGVTKAGYSVREEFPILLIVFAVPAIIAAVALWQLSRS
jgi:hypothetical protein